MTVLDPQQVPQAAVVAGPPPVPPAAAVESGWTPPLDPAPLRLALLALVGGVVFDLGVRGGVDNVVVALGVAVVVAALVTDGRLRSAEARWLAAAAVVPALGLGLRSSPWVVTADVFAILTLLGIAVVHARSGSLFDTSPLRLLRRSVNAAGRAAIAPVVLRRLVPSMSKGTANTVGRLLVALVVAVPVLAIVVLLLAEADAVFASFVDADVDLGPAVGHVVVALIFAAWILCVGASALGDSPDDVPSGRFGVLETATILGLTVAVLGLFVVAQLVALTDAGDRLVEEAGLTPAEYARSGFFQLCWAAAFLVFLLALVRTLAAPGVMATPTVRILAAVVPVLTAGLVVVSLWRMQLYDDAFGLTMLRLWVVGTALWMGAVLLMIALRNGGVGGERNWVFGGAVVAALVLVLVANVANPEAFVVRHNVARAEDGAELDADYLSDLSDDAVPALVAALDDVPRSHRLEIEDALRCTTDAVGADALNLAASRAANAREDAALEPTPCPTYRDTD